MFRNLFKVTSWHHLNIERKIHSKEVVIRK